MTIITLIFGLSSVIITFSNGSNKSISGTCATTHLCKLKTQYIKCSMNHHILITSVRTTSQRNISCDDFKSLHTMCNFQRQCRVPRRLRCCDNNSTIVIRHSCIQGTAVDLSCSQSRQNPLSNNIRHIYYKARKSEVTRSSKQKPPFCQWKVNVPSNTFVIFRIVSLYKPLRQCHTSTSLMIQYGLKELKRPKYVMDIPTCVYSTKPYDFILSKNSDNILIWFTPTTFNENVWIAFTFKKEKSAFVMPNSTGCTQKLTYAQNTTRLKQLSSTSIGVGNVPSDSAIPVWPGKRHHVSVTTDLVMMSTARMKDSNTRTEEPWQAERLTYLAVIAALVTIAIFFIVVTVMLFCRLYRLRFISKGFSRLAKLPAADFDLVKSHKVTLKKNDQIGEERNNKNLFTEDDSNNDRTIYSVAKRQPLDNSVDILKRSQMSTPTYAVPWENIRDDLASLIIKRQDVNRKSIPDSIQRPHVDLTDDMFKSAPPQMRPNHASHSNEQTRYNDGDKIIDVRVLTSDEIPARFRESTTVENALYDSPEEDETY